MSPKRWLPSRRRRAIAQQPGRPPDTSRDLAVPEPPGPDGFWLTDTDFLARLHSATAAMLDIADGVMEGDFTLIEALASARHHAAELLGIPAEYAVLVEAEAAAQIVDAAGLVAGGPFGPAVAHGLARIDQMPVEHQQQVVRAAARRFAFTAPPPGRTASAAAPPGPRPRRSR
jgi:hypothetical protein